MVVVLVAAAVVLIGIVGMSVLYPLLLSAPPSASFAT
jgi:hypothetical protein